jgi:hypothetical protein
VGLLTISAIATAAGAALLALLATHRRAAIDPDAAREPRCGQCGYIVRGLQGMTCPECGGDLREVGIVAPGVAPVLGRGKRILIWTLAAPLPAIILYAMLSPFVIPQWQITSHRRVIFSQSSYCFVTVTANASGRKLVFGSAAGRAPVAPEMIFLSNNVNNVTMSVRLPDRTYDVNRAGKVVRGKFDAKAVETWLNDSGFTDARVADRSKDIVAAVDEIGTPAGNGFTQFARDANPPFAPTGVAHPTFVLTRPQPNELTKVSGVAFGVLVWLAGLPLALREPSRRIGGVPEPGFDIVKTDHAATSH